MTETVEHAAAGIVSIYGRRGSGSSGIVWRDNLVLTSSASVRVDEGARLGLPDGRVVAARVRGRDSGTDLAVLEMEADGPTPLPLQPDQGLKTGQIVIAVGRTSNTGPIASFGIVSGVAGEWKTWRGGKIDPFVRLDISPYSTLSGGAALTADRGFFGVISMGLSRSSVFAITKSTIDRVTTSLLEQGYVSRGFLGTAVQPVALPQSVKEQVSQEAGIMLVGLEPEGPAATGGLLLGDVLVAAEVNSSRHSLAQPNALAEMLERTNAGQTARFQILRAGILQEQEIRIGERPTRGR